MDPYLINPDVDNLEILHVRGNGEPSQCKQINLGLKFKSEGVKLLLTILLCFLCGNINEELSNYFIVLDPSHQVPSHEEYFIHLNLVVYQVKGIYY